MNDAELIESFAKERAEAPFRLLVERHLPLVLGTARRITGDNGVAQEVAQTVFILLARKAGSIRRGTIISGWLYRTTCFVAARALRSEQRRWRREQEAVAMQTETDSEPLPAEITAHLDRSLQRLSRKERDAILLRFFEERPLSEVSVSLGISEDAAKKRVSRALEKLRQFLGGRGLRITSAALVAGLVHETAKAAAGAAVISKVTATALAPTVTSALLADVLSAWRWAKIKMLLGAGSGVVATALLVSQAVPFFTPKKAAQSPNSFAAAAGATASNSSSPASAAAANNFETIDMAGQTLPAHPLLITVLDKLTGHPIAGAEVMHSLMWSGDPQQRPAPLRTSAKGAIAFAVPDQIPGDQRMNQFSVSIHAKDYAPREIMWLSSTGSVLTLVSNDYTVRLETGLSISGTVVDDNSQPLEGVRVGALGNNYEGYTWSSVNGKVVSPPVLRVEDFASFERGSEDSDAVTSDQFGRFHFEHFPSDLKRVLVDLIGPDGSRRKFRTPQGKALSADDVPDVSFEQLLTGTDRLVLPAGITVAGEVVDAAGEPVRGATVSEGTQWGNLRILSTCYTDFAGRFWLSNRPPREIILAASADGYANASVIASVKKGMARVRIQLPPEQPLRGRVVNESGTPLSKADIRLYDVHNEGLGMKWDDKTDSEGRFEWRGAPTNDVALMISAESSFKLVRLHATTNEQIITLPSHNDNAAYITGTVADATSGKPLEHFTVNVCHSRWSDSEVAQTAEGANGAFSINTSQSEVAVGNSAYWFLVIEADGYEPLRTREYDYAEGDQKLDLKLQPGGTVEGRVRSPDGKLVSDCQVAISRRNEIVQSMQAGMLLPTPTQRILATTDPNGHFELNKPLKTTSLVLFDKSGWAVVPITSNSENLEVRLHPWGRIEGVLMNGNTPVGNERIGIDNLINNSTTAVRLLQSVDTDETGHFAFDRVPAGEYQVALESPSWQRAGQETVNALETAVSVTGGETNHITLALSGCTVSARLVWPNSIAPASWSDCIAELKLDVAVPPRPSRADFITDASYSAAQEAYDHDATVLAAKRRERTYVGTVTRDGSAIFENVPPGNYLFEAKVFSKERENEYQPFKITAQLSTSVIVSADVADASASIALGSFTLETL